MTDSRRMSVGFRRDLRALVPSEPGFKSRLPDPPTKTSIGASRGRASPKPSAASSGGGTPIKSMTVTEKVTETLTADDGTQFDVERATKLTITYTDGSTATGVTISWP